jgi:hypothetical protein
VYLYFLFVREFFQVPCVPEYLYFLFERVYLYFLCVRIVSYLYVRFLFVSVFDFFVRRAYRKASDGGSQRERGRGREGEGERE